MKITNFFKNKRNVVSIICLLVLIGTGLMVTKSVRHNKKNRSDMRSANAYYYFYYDSKSSECKLTTDYKTVDECKTAKKSVCYLSLPECKTANSSDSTTTGTNNQRDMMRGGGNMGGAPGGGFR